MDKVKRNVLLNPGPSTTTDTVKMAQVVPDICPREKEFGDIMRKMRTDLVKIVHGDPQKYTSVLFCGSGTINLDICINSLLPEGKKILVINNGAYRSGIAVPLLFRIIPAAAYPISITRTMGAEKRNLILFVRR